MAAAISILAVGRVVGGIVHFDVAPLVSLVPPSDDDVDALIDGVMGKPGLGVADSAGLFDYDEAEYGSIEDDHEWIRGGC